MNKVIGIVIAVLVIGGVSVFALINNNDADMASNSTTPPSQATSGPDTVGPASEGRPAMDQSIPESSQSKTVIMSNLEFSPAKITIKKGTTVTWTNQDDAQHDVNPDNPTDEFKKSSLFGKGGSYSVTFNTVGTYTYKCTPHPFMKGVVEVTE